ncbi:MAG: hypothetical protein OXH13_08940 [Chloroflexi bacterium]|nr:hypothetical protein [Chloroflexota bacterium]MCY3697596.1 hypothetical protein [Chloroflexota bacterium]
MPRYRVVIAILCALIAAAGDDFAGQGDRELPVMNADGEFSGLSSELRPAAEVLEEIVSEAIEVFTSRPVADLRVAVGA